MKNKILFLFVIISSFAVAQDFNSPFSINGFGSSYLGSQIRDRGMGNSYLRYTSENQYSILNPSSYTDVTSLGFNLGAEANRNNLLGTNTDYINTAYTPSYISLCLPFTKPDSLEGRRGGFAMGVRTNTNYQYEFSNKTSYLQDSFVSNFLGDGGITNAFLGIGYKLFPFLSLGLQADYLFGYLENKEQYSIDGNNQIFVLNKNKNYTLYGIVPKVSMALNIPLQQNKTLSISGVYSFQSKLRVRESTEMLSYLSPSPSRPFDSIVSTVENTSSETYPYLLAAGISYDVKDKLNITLQSEYFPFNVATFNTAGSTLNDRLLFSGGVEYQPNSIKPNSRSFVDFLSVTKYRVGARLGNLESTVAGEDNTIQAVTFGFGFPIAPPNYYRPKTYEKHNYVEVSFELGQMGNSSTNSFRNRYLMVGLGFHVFEWKWFEKRKID